MLKKDDTASSKIVIGLKCGECFHYEKYAKFEKPCSKLGVTRKANAPACFTPNVFALQKVAPDILAQLGFLLKEFTAPQARILLSLLRSKRTYDRYGLAFGQPVFFRLGQDYVANYFRGFVVGVTSHGEPMVYVSSDMNKKQIGTPNMLALMPDSVFSVSKFKAHRTKLIDSGKINDPNPLPLFKKVHPKTVSIDYEPPTIESVPDHWFDAYSRPGNTMPVKGAQKKKGSSNDIAKGVFKVNIDKR